MTFAKGEGFVINKLAVAAISAAALAAAPAAAQAGSPHRAPAAMAGQDEHIVGLLWQYLLLPIIIGAVVALVAGRHHDQPVSP